MMIVKDGTSWSITLELSITLLESSIMLLDNIYSAGFTKNRHLQSSFMIVKHLQFRLQWPQDLSQVCGQVFKKIWNHSVDLDGCILLKRSKVIASFLLLFSIMTLAPDQRLPWVPQYGISFSKSNLQVKGNDFIFQKYFQK